VAVGLGEVDDCNVRCCLSGVGGGVGSVGFPNATDFFWSAVVIYLILAKIIQPINEEKG